MQSPGGEQGMEQRLILVFLVMGAVLLISQYFLPKPPPPKKPATTPSAAKPATPAPVTPARAAAAAANTAVQLKAAAEERIELDNGVAHVTLSNHGAVVHSWNLKQYRDKRGRELDVVNNFPTSRNTVWYPLQIDARGGQIEPNPNYVYWVPKRDADGLGVTFEYASAGMTYRKRVRLEKNSYVAQVTSEVLKQGQPVAHSLAWRGGFGDFYVFNAAGSMSTHYYTDAERKVIYRMVPDVEKAPRKQTGAIPLAGLQDAFFAAVFMPKTSQGVEIHEWAEQVTGGPGTGVHAHPSIAVGSVNNDFRLFVGPKQLDLLDKLDPRLALLVDFGWFEIVSRPLFYALRYLHNSVTQNWGWAIVLLTVIINVLLTPLKLSSYKSGKKMQAIQPEIAKINKKYEGVGLRDPRNQQKNEEMMALYNKHNINLGGGCVPLLVQLPFFYGFFNVLRGAIELRGADWLWVTDLSQPEQIPIRVLPLLMVVTGLVLQRLTPITVPDPEQARQQQTIFLVMQLVLGFTFWNFSSGLVLYWLTGNLIGLLQTWVLNRFGDQLMGPMPQVAPASTVSTPAKGSAPKPPAGGSKKR